MDDRTSGNYIVISVSSINERDKMVKRIYTSLTKEPNIQFTILQDQINRVRILHNVREGVKIPIRTYLVVVIPIIMDLSPLHNIFGSVEFDLEHTIDHLTKLLHRLQSMNGHKVIKGVNNNEQTLRQLASSLS